MAQVTVYSTPTCSHCLRAKKFLDDNGIAYTNYDVGADQAKADEMTRKSGQMGVPVLDIDGKIIVGFDRDAVKQALGLP